MALRYTSTGTIAHNGNGTIFSSSKRRCIKLTLASIVIDALTCRSYGGGGGINSFELDADITDIDGDYTSMLDCTYSSFTATSGVTSGQGYSDGACATLLGPISFGSIGITFAVSYAAPNFTIVGTMLGNTVFSNFGAFGAAISSGVAGTTGTITVSCP